MASQTSNASTSAELSSLGAGGEEDRLHFKLVFKILLRCVPLLKRVWVHLAVILGVSALFSIGMLYPFLQMLDIFWVRVLKGDPMTTDQAEFLNLDPALVTQVEQFTEEVRKMVLERITIIGTVLTLAAVLIFTALYYYRIWILQRINQFLRLQFIDKLQTLSMRFHSDNKAGDAVYRIFQDSSMVTQMINVLLLHPLQAVGRYVFSIVAVLLYDPWLGLAFAIVWPPVVIIAMFFSQRLRVGFRRARESNSLLTSTIQESMTGIRVIKAYGAEPEQQARFESRSRDAFAAAFTGRTRLAIYKTLIFWALGLILVGSIGWATLLTVDNVPVYGETILGLFGISLWNLGSYNGFKSFAGGCTRSARGLMTLWGQIQDIAIGLDRVFEVLDLTPDVEEYKFAEEMRPFKSRIIFKDISFGYRADRHVLHDIDLHVKSGTVTAIIGPTGAGKSTLMMLLLRLFDPDKGMIEIDGIDIRKFKIASLRGNISIALQENILFGTTVKENIRYAAPDADDEKIREAARIACADEFIQYLPDQYNTLLGERGTKLSSGQRQRLSIARAIIKGTPILILDEPTSSLDAETEVRLLSNLMEWGKGKAIFMITHRLSTIRYADQVALIQNGRLAEFGTHEQLMSRTGGAYRLMMEEDIMIPDKPVPGGEG